MASQAGTWLPWRSEDRLGVGARPTQEAQHVLRRNRRAQKLSDDAIVDNQGDLIVEERRVPIGDGEPLLAALEGPRPLKVVVETCPFWPWICDVIEPTEIGFHLAHASRLEAIAKAKTKSDSVDARLLARMLATGLVPEVYPKPPKQRELCRLVRHRKVLVEERTSLWNRIHGHLQQQGLRIGRKRLQSREGRTWLPTAASTW